MFNSHGTHSSHYSTCLLSPELLTFVFLCQPGKSIHNRISISPLLSQSRKGNNTLKRFFLAIKMCSHIFQKKIARKFVRHSAISSSRRPRDSYKLVYPTTRAQYTSNVDKTNVNVHRKISCCCYPLVFFSLSHLLEEKFVKSIISILENFKQIATDSLHQENHHTFSSKI